MLIDRRVPDLPSGVERYRVPGSGAAVVPISAGDRITIIDVEGGQPCEVAGGGASGRVDPGLIGGKVCGIADGLRGHPGERIGERACGAGRAAPPQHRSRRRPRRCGCSAATAPAVRRRRSPRRGPGVLIVAAPGDAMTPETQDTATEIEVRIARASPRSEEFALLPDPLADARLDFEVPRSSARAYEVKEGDYHPDRRPVRPAVLGLPLPQCARPAEGDRARPRQRP